MGVPKDLEENYNDAKESGELESIEDWEKKKLSLWLKIVIWMVVFTLTFWSVAWFY